MNIRNILNSMLLPFMALIVAPFTFYFVNINEYQSSLFELVKYSLIVFVVATVLILLLSKVLGKWRKYLFVSVIIFSFIIWVQSQILVWDFGPLDGRGVNWEKWNNHAIFEILFFFVTFGLLFFLLKRNEKLRKNLTIGLFLLGFYSLAHGWFSAPDRVQTDTKNVSVTGRDSVSFSKDKNNILIILDTFQSNAFQEILNNYPDEVEFLDNFTFFPNTVGGYPTTQPSIPMMISGNVYQNEKPILEWTEENNQSSKFTEVYKENSQFVSLVHQTLAGVKSEIYSVEDFKEVNIPVSLQNYIKVLDGGFFKSLPTFLKKPYYSEGNWFIAGLIEKKAASVDQGFVNYFNRFAHVTQDDKKTFRFYHLHGPHWPLQVDENYNYQADMPETWESYIKQSRGALTQLKIILDKLKSLGIYESATITVVGDHGSVHFMGNDFYGQLDEWSNFIPPEVLAAARPLYMVKKPTHQRHKDDLKQSGILISDSPKHLKDIMCEFNDDKDCFADYTVRNFYFYDWNEEYWEWQKDFLPPMKPYIIKGDVRDLSSWSKSNKYFSNGKIFDDKNNFKVGSSIIFNDSNRLNVSSLMLSGWDVPEANSYWTDGNIARLKFYISDCIDRKCTLRLHASPFLPANKTFQTVKVLINDNHLNTWQMSTQDWYEVVIPQGLIDETGEVRVQFEIEEPTAPCDLSDSDDCRKLGFAAIELAITDHKNGSSTEDKSEPTVQSSNEAVLPIKLGQTVDFSAKGTAQNYIMQGWSWQEEVSVWTEGNVAHLQLPIEDTENTALRLKLFGNGFAPKNQGHQLVKVRVNGQQVAEWQVGDPAWHEALISAEIVGSAQPMQVEFVIDEPTAPCEISDAQDCRKLGLSVRELVIERQ